MKRSEKAIEADIIKALRDMGFFVTKFSQPRNTMQTHGTPDLYAAHPGWRIRFWCEVKTERGVVSPYQSVWHINEIMAGGKVIVARSVGDVLDALKRMGAPIVIPRRTA